MGELVTIKPDLRFDFEWPFEIKDSFNGPHRGTFFFRSKVDGEVKGPFESWAVARLCQQQDDLKLESY